MKVACMCVMFIIRTSHDPKKTIMKKIGLQNIARQRAQRRRNPREATWVLVHEVFAFVTPMFPKKTIMKKIGFQNIARQRAKIRALLRLRGFECLVFRADLSDVTPRASTKNLGIQNLARQREKDSRLL